MRRAVAERNRKLQSRVAIALGRLGDRETELHFEHAELDTASAQHYESGWARTFDKLERASG